MIFGDFSKAVGQFWDPAFRRVLLRGVLLTLLLLGPFVFGMSVFLQWVVPESVTIPLYGPVTFLDNLASGVGAIVLLFLMSFLMIPVAIVFIGFFLDEVAAAVEAKHYPHLPKVPRQPVFHLLIDAIRFMGIVVLANLVALIFYLIFAPLAPFIFWAVNGFLLGREYFQLVALRRMPLKEANALRSRHFLGIWFAGFLMAIPLTVPLLSLFVPILGVATFTHQFHRLSARR